MVSDGLSPRGRGNLVALVAVVLPDGSIPAWAGEPHPKFRPSGRRRVYPRVGGGTTACWSPGRP